MWRSNGDDRLIAAIRPEFPTDAHVLRYLLRVLGNYAIIDIDSYHNYHTL